MAEGNQDDFERKLSEEETSGLKARLENAPAIGSGPGESLNVVQPGSPKFKPIVIDVDGNEIDLDEADTHGEMSEEDMEKALAEPPAK